MGIALRWLSAAALAVSTPVLAQSAPYLDERYRITLKGGGLGIDADEIIVVSLVINDSTRQRWIAERLRIDRDWCAIKVDGRCSAGEKVTHEWIDGQTCPALKSMLESLAGIRVTGFAPPARSDRSAVTDTPLLTVSGTPDHITGYGALLSLAGFTGPIVNWWDRSDRQLTPCWTVAIPTSRGKSLEAKLTPNPTH